MVGTAGVHQTLRQFWYPRETPTGNRVSDGDDIVCHTREAAVVETAESMAATERVGYFIKNSSGLVDSSGSGLAEQHLLPQLLLLAIIEQGESGRLITFGGGGITEGRRCACSKYVRKRPLALVSFAITP